MRRWGQFDAYDVARLDPATHDDDAHHARLPNEIAFGIPVEHGREEPILEIVELRARVAQTRYLDNRLTDMQPRSGRQVQEVDPVRGHVLAHVAGANVEAFRPQLIVQL